MIIGEIAFYWSHRSSHQVPLPWQFHPIHHNAEHVDWLVNTRANPVDIVFTRLCGLVPLYALGLAAPLGGSASVIPVIVLLLGTVWGFFVHANVRWRFGRLEWLSATPAFHHWHQTNDGSAHVDKNYAAMPPWIDRLFGTFALPGDKRPARYGNDHPVPSSLFEQSLGPFMPRLPGSPHPVEMGLPPVPSEARTPVGSPATSDHDFRLRNAAADDHPHQATPISPAAVAPNVLLSRPTRPRCAPAGQFNLLRNAAMLARAREAASPSGTSIRNCS